MRFGPTISAAKPKLPHLPTLGQDLVVDILDNVNAKQAVRFTRLDEPVIHLKLDETSGTTAVNSGSGSDGTYARDASNTTTTALVAGAAQTFVAAAGDEVDLGVPAQLAAGEDVSFSMVINTTQAQTRALLDCRSDSDQDGYALWVNGSGYVTAMIRHSGNIAYAFGSTAIADGENHWICVTIDRDGVIAIYCDDPVTPDDTTDCSAYENYDLSDGVTSTYIANKSWTGSSLSRFNGTIDDVRIDHDVVWNTFQRELIHQWDMEDKVETTTASQYAEVAAHVDIALTTNEAFTWLARVWVPDLTKNYRFLYYYAGSGNNRSWLLRSKEPSGIVRFTIYDDGSTATNLDTAGSLNAGAWNTIGCVHDPTGNILAVYLNGVYKTNIHTGGIHDAGGKAHQIGTFGTNRSWAQFEGIRYFDSALTEAEITAEFTSAKPVLTPVYNYECDSNDGVLVDGQGNHDATITGGSTLVNGYWEHTADDEDPVYSCGDGNQTNPAARPLFRLPGYLDFDGGDDHLVTPKTPGNVNTLYAVGSIAGDGQTLVGCSDGEILFRMGRAGGKIAAAVGSADESTIQGTSDPSTPAVFCLRNDGANVSLFVNGEREYHAAHPGDPSGSQPLYLGASNSDGVADMHAACHLYATRRFLGVAHSDSQIAITSQKLKAKHGV